VTIIDLIRHGEPVGGRRYRGQTDDPLSETGWRQMWAAVGQTAPWDAIVASPLRRCSEFAHALADRHGIAIRLEDRLMEIGFGVWEGYTGEEIRRQDGEALRRFYADPVRNRPEGAEPLEHFVARVLSAWNEIVTECEGGHVLVVCHAGVMRAVVAHLLEIELVAAYRIRVDNAAVVRTLLTEERPPSVMFSGSPYLR
jgi:alpha-ribazole phosphatase/probable phosphoglycerate mutase